MPERDQELDLNSLELNYILAGWSKNEQAKNEALLRDAVSGLEKKLRAEFKKQDEYYLNLANKHADAEVWARMPQLAKRRYTPKGHEHADDFRGGGADCMFDYLISECITDAGIPEGTEFTSITGCPYLVYSHPSLAIDHANANRTDTRENTVFFNCSGIYTIDTEMVPDPPNSGSYVFYGAGAYSTRWMAGSSSLTLCSTGTQSGDESSIHFVNIGFSNGTDISRSSIICLEFSGGREFQVRNCYFDLGSTSIGIIPGEGRASLIDGCHFSGIATGIANATSGASGSAANLLITNCSFSDITTGISYESGACEYWTIQDNYFDCTNGIEVAGTSSGARHITVGGNIFDCTKGILWTNAGDCQNWVISDNVFVVGSGVGIDFDPLGVGDECYGINIQSNVFEGAASGIGIRGDTTILVGSKAANNTFRQFTSGNEITQFTGTGNRAYHNESYDVNGVLQTMADIGSPYGHSSTATAAPNDATYVVATDQDATLPNSRLLTAGTNIDITDGGAAGNITIDVDLTETPHDLEGAAHVTSSGVDGHFLRQTGAATYQFEADYYTVDLIIDGGASAISTGIKADVEIPSPGVIEEWRLLLSASDTMTVTMTTCAYAGFDTFAAFSPALAPAVVGAVKAEATGLTTAVVAEDIWRFEVTGAPASATRCTLAIKVRKT